MIFEQGMDERPKLRLGKNRANLVGRVFAESENDGSHDYGKLYVFQNGKCV